MNTEVTIDGTRFLLNGKVPFPGSPAEGLLMNSRMIQAVFDDDCPDTRPLWAYPDTGRWDPDRNTDEFCAALPLYREHGLLAVTVGLQGGGSIYRPEVYGNYIASAYEPDGTFKQPWFDRLLRVLQAADGAGMVVIVNYLYHQQARRLEGEHVLRSITERVTDWLLGTGLRNILVDVANEAADWWTIPQCKPDRIHELIEIARGVTRGGRRLLVGCSTGGGEQIPTGSWLKAEDFTMPHGNGQMPDELAAKLRRIKQQPEYVDRPRPVIVNEDSVFVENMRAAVGEGVSWGFYCQGYGSGYRDRMDWRPHGREDRCEDLSGYQTLPVNWTINTDIKRAFFDGVRELTTTA